MSAPDESQTLSDIFADLLRQFAPLGSEAEPFSVEMVASEVLGQLWEGGDELALDLIEFARAEHTAEAAALLAAMGELGTTNAQREAARSALAEMTASGVTEPSWAARLGDYAPGECVLTGDVYGDACSLLCVFGADAEAHGVLALIDLNELGGWVRDVAVVEAPDDVLGEMRAQDEDAEGLVTVERLTQARTHRLLRDGFAATERIVEPEIGEDFVRFRALALARMRALPEPEPSPAPRALSVGEREQAVEEFIGADEVADTPQNRECARLIVDYGADHDPCRPLRVGPEKLALFVESLFDDQTELDEDTLHTVLPAWARWRAAREGLAEPAVEALLDGVRQCLDEAEDDQPSAESYLDGTEDVDDPDELAETLDRRMFAVPSVYAEIGDEELELDPLDPEQRRLLVVGEHPEYHEALAADSVDAEPRMRLAVKTTVVDQLWDNDPPQAWQAAQRLRSSGMRREQILDELARVLTEQLHPVGEEDMEFELEDYVAALDRLS